MHTSRRVLACDFEGVICDGVRECLLSVWNTWHCLSVDAFSEETLLRIPTAFVARFTYLRNFVRHSGQFLVVLATDAALQTADEFDAAYRRIPERHVRDFLLRFEAYRAAVMHERHDVWLGMHSFYSRIENVLRRQLKTLYIVSGKDRASIQCLLASKDIDLPDSRIFADQKSKVLALRDICERENVAPENIIFCDDNVRNVQEAQRAGFLGMWAEWGYPAPSDITSAQSPRVLGVSLKECVEMCG